MLSARAADTEGLSTRVLCNPQNEVVEGHRLPTYGAGMGAGRVSKLPPVTERARADSLTDKSWPSSDRAVQDLAQPLAVRSTEELLGAVGKRVLGGTLHDSTSPSLSSGTPVLRATRSHQALIMCF